MGSALTDDGMCAHFFADHRCIAAQEHGHRGCVFTGTRLSIFINCSPIDCAVFTLIANSVGHFKLCVLFSSEAGVAGQLLDGVIIDLKKKIRR